MKYLFIFLLSFLSGSLLAQDSKFKVFTIPLPAELANPENQVSGLYVHQGKLFFLAESRLQEQAEGKIYAIRVQDLHLKRTDPGYVLPYQKYHLNNLEELRTKIDATGQSYEGLEAMVISGNKVYLTVETNTTSSHNYLLQGQLQDTAVNLNPNFLMPIPKPKSADGAYIHNAGFEALVKWKKHLLAFFEYNYFPAGNFVYQLNLTSHPNASPVQNIPFQKLPFRITDITPVSKKHFTAINYFFKGGGPDSVYRPPAGDLEYRKLIYDGGDYRSYTRLIRVKITKKAVTWKPLWELPEPYWSYNWEGIAAYKKQGFFMINDKYTPEKPYVTTLLYLERN